LCYDGREVYANLLNSVGQIVCGDRVLISVDGNTHKIIKKQKRKNYLYRITKHGKKQQIAANLDKVLIVCSATLDIDTLLLDKIITICQRENIKTTLVVNKIDLIKNKQIEKIKKITREYQKIMQVFFVCAFDIKTKFKNIFKKKQINIFVGESGVGKSSLTNSLCKNSNIKTNYTNKKGYGTHTTSTTKIYKSKNNSFLMDSPGVRDFLTKVVDKKDIIKSFVEFEKLKQHCKYNDCWHLKEPNCAVKKAVAENKIAKFRYENYKKLMYEKL
jgi:ribosome biogenesis GTPase / thiamine phosphate phosphatase